MPRVVFFIGTAGAGKSYISKQIAALLDADWVSSGDIVRAMPDAQEDLEAGRLYKNDQLVIEHTTKFIESSSRNIVIIDGVPRNLLQIAWVRDSIWSKMDCFIVYVDAPIDRRLKRIMLRNRDKYDDSEIVLKRVSQDMAVIFDVLNGCLTTFGNGRILSLSSDKDGDVSVEVASILSFIGHGQYKN